MNAFALPQPWKLVLASASPRRRDLLAAAGIACTVRPAAVKEVRNGDEYPPDYVERLAREKASAIEIGDDEIALGADTTVVVNELFDPEVLEKPRDEEDARRMLKLLAGNKHLVMTGICLRRGDRIVTAVEKTTVHFGPMSLGEIDAYVATGEPMDKAGAYAIQGVASRWITRIDGCYFNVVGLPVARVWRELILLLAQE
jgi:septum formation protein